MKERGAPILDRMADISLPTTALSRPDWRERA
jgi:hypothetical protein